MRKTQKKWKYQKEWTYSLIVNDEERRFKSTGKMINAAVASRDQQQT
jgi:hypothetical protein